MADTKYTVEYAKSGRSTCKRSKAVIPQKALRIGKLVPNPRDEVGADFPTINLKVIFILVCLIEGRRTDVPMVSSGSFF